MKKIVLSAGSLAIAAALTLTLLTRPAYAVDAKAKFASMKKAVLASQKPGNTLELTDKHTFQDGNFSAWAVLNGELIELKSGQAMVIEPGPNGNSIKKIDFAGSIPPEVEEQMKKLMEEALKNGDFSTSTQAIVDGKEVSIDEVNAILKGMGIDLEIKINLDEKNYESISFGATHDSLVLTPKGKKNKRFVVDVDAKSNLPQNVVLEINKDGKWSKVKESDIELAIGK